MQGLRSQKKRSLHEVNEHFFDERNAAGGHYGQALNSVEILMMPRIPLILLFYALSIAPAGAGDWFRLNLEPDLTATIPSDIYYEGFKVSQTISALKLSEVMTEKGIFTTIEATGFNSAAEYGAPLLPVVNRLIEIPHGAEVEFRILSFNEEVVDLQTYGFTGPLYPWQPSPSKNSRDPGPGFVFLENEYRKDMFPVTDIVGIEELGVMRGRRIGRLRLSPVQYNPVKNQLRVLSEIKIGISFRNGDTGTDYNKGRYGSSFHEASFASGILNYRKDNRKSYFEGGPVRFVILADPMFEEALQEFIQWKTRKGFEVIELYKGVNGAGETPQEMRAALAELYHSATPEDPAPTFLLIVGDHEQIPGFQGSGHVTDLYYAEYDGNGDMFPDLFYGRFSANNVEELMPQIDKTLMYEQYLFPETGFLNEAVLIAGVDSRYASVHGNGQINYGKANYFNESSGINAHAYLVPHESGVAQAIIDKISVGAGIVNYTGHGFPYRWDNPRFSTDDIPGLDNSGKYPLMIGNGCETNRFELYESLGEALLRAEDKGAVGYIGGSNDTYWDEDFFWAVGVGPISSMPVYEETGPGAYDRLFHTRGEPAGEWYVAQGQIQQAGNLAVTEGATASRARYYWEVYHLMGDPSLMIYFSEPDPLDAEYQKVLVAGTGELAVRTEPYTYVALSGNNGLVDAKYSNESGLARLTFDPLEEPGEYTLVATRENRQPHIGSIAAAPEHDPWVAVNSFTLDDSRSNNNGIAESGESVFIDLTVKNAGGGTAEDLTLKLSAGSSYVEVFDAEHYISVIEAGAEISVTGIFGFDISPGIPDGESVFLTLEVHGDDTLKWTSNFTIDVKSPGILILRAWADSNNDPDSCGFLMAGESGGLVIEFVNSGSSEITSAEFRLNDSSGQLQTGDVVAFDGPLQPGDTLQVTFDVAADGAVEYGSLLDLSMETVSAYFVSENEFGFYVNTVFEDFEEGMFGRRPWKTDPEKGWVFSSDASRGNYSLRSGEIGHSDSSILEIYMEVTSEGKISFFRKLSSERNYDFLEFYIDGDRMGRWSGFLNWSSVEFDVMPGNRSFRWVYVKDKSVSKGLDRAWIDEVVFPQGRMLAVLPGEEVTDIGIEGLTSPVSGQWMTDPWPVTVIIRNYGNITVSSFQASYSVNGASPVTATIEESISPGDTLSFSFPEKADLGEPGYYDLLVYTSHPADTIPGNDSLLITIDIPEVYDIALASLLSPQSGSDMGDAEAVTVEIENRGNVGLTNIEMYYQLNELDPVSGIFEGLLLPGTIAEYSFEQPVDMSSQGLYYLTVYAATDHDAKAGRDTLFAEIENVVTSLSGLTHQSALYTVYPNPAGHELFIKLSRPVGGQGLIRLFSATGQLLYQVLFRQPEAGDIFRIDTSGLAPGSYYLEISRDNEREVFRIVRK